MMEDVGPYLILLGQPLSEQEHRRPVYKKESHRPERTRAYRLMRKYGLQVDEFDRAVEKQNGRCAICGKVPTKRLVVDHDHQTGKVRGLLCNDCNIGIGKLGDTSEALQKALRYLLEPPGIAAPDDAIPMP